MRVLVLGATGMLGHVLVRTLHPQHEVTGTVRQLDPSHAPTHRALAGVRLLSDVQADDFDSVVRAVESCRPEAVVNCIGIVKQLAAAKDPIPSIAINALFPHRLAELTRSAGARLIHLSTDCVFAGTKGTPYTEDDCPDPVDLYGRTKLLGEVSQPGSLTLRTSIIGRELRNHTGLVEWFLSQRGGTVRGFAGALYSGLTTNVLARLIGDLLTRFPDLSGVWQVASEPINKYDLLLLLNERFRTGTAITRDTNFACDRRLDGARFVRATGFQCPAWPAMVDELAAEMELYTCKGEHAAC